MTTTVMEIPPIDAVLVLGDEFAPRVLGGLSQFDRLLAVLHECFGSSDTTRSVPMISVLWRSPVEQSDWLTRSGACPPSRLQVTHLKPGDASGLTNLARDARVLLVGTRMVFGRDTLHGLLADDRLPRPFILLTGGEVARLGRAADAWQELFSRLPNIRGTKTAAGFATTLMAPADIRRVEKGLFRSLGRPTDGLASRKLNRLVSAAISRHFAAAGVTPAQASFLVMGVAAAGAVALAFGGTIGLVVAVCLNQAASMLDGCDGELARVGYRESAEGARLDSTFDSVYPILLAAGLGVGLARTALPPGSGAHFLWEALLIGAARGLNSTTLRRFGRMHGQEQPGRTIKSRILRRTGAWPALQRVVSAVIDLLGRDNSSILFLLLGLAGQASVILHLLALATCIEMAGTLWGVFGPVADS